jgi:hypothetical protein
MDHWTQLIAEQVLNSNSSADNNTRQLPAVAASRVS